MTVPDGYHAARLPADPRRGVLWRALWQYYFSALIGSGDCVLDLGAGYGHFINATVARRRIAIDAWPGFLRYLDPGVEGHVGPVTELGMLEDGSVDFAFASNLFEHLTRLDFQTTLAELAPKLAPGATLTILQPNYRYAYREYFDDFDHKVAYSHVSLPQYLESQGWEVFVVEPRFMPLTVQGSMPVHPLLIRVWLASPWKPIGKQMLIRARLRR